MQQQDFPILEFDSTQEAMLEPKHLIKPMEIPERAVACFFQDVSQYSHISIKLA